MYRIRIIPCLLIRNNSLVKSVRFLNPTYVGDPLNAVKIFNDREADELILLDIDASKSGSGPNFESLSQISTEAFMPLCYGGGISSVEQAEKIIKLGFEKISINSAVIQDITLIERLSSAIGSQSVVVAIDVKKDWLGRYRVFDSSRNTLTNIDPIEHAQRSECFGAGEIFLSNVSHDGMQNGYDLTLIKTVSESVNIPVIICGGASSTDDFKMAVNAGAAAMAAGSMFVFQGKHRAVLISYPSNDEIENLSNSVKNNNT